MSEKLITTSVDLSLVNHRKHNDYEAVFLDFNIDFEHVAGVYYMPDSQIPTEISWKKTGKRQIKVFVPRGMGKAKIGATIISDNKEIRSNLLVIDV